MTMWNGNFVGSHVVFVVLFLLQRPFDSKSDFKTVILSIESLTK